MSGYLRLSMCLSNVFKCQVTFHWKNLFVYLGKGSQLKAKYSLKIKCTLKMKSKQVFNEMTFVDAK